jgi:hypothetical protein
VLSPETTAAKWEPSARKPQRATISSGSRRSLTVPPPLFLYCVNGKIRRARVTQAKRLSQPSWRSFLVCRREGSNLSADALPMRERRFGEVITVS